MRAETLADGGCSEQETQPFVGELQISVGGLAGAAWTVCSEIAARNEKRKAAFAQLMRFILKAWGSEYKILSRIISDSCCNGPPTTFTDYLYPQSLRYSILAKKSFDCRSMQETSVPGGRFHSSGA